MESKKMMTKELSFMKKKGAPKSMIKHEKAEAKGMNKGGKTSCYAKGGVVKKMAMGGGANIPQGKNNAFTMAVGAFDTQQAVAASYATVVSPNAQINASVGYGMGGESQLGARIGTTFSW